MLCVDIMSLAVLKADCSYMCHYSKISPVGAYAPAATVMWSPLASLQITLAGVKPASLLPG